jgi:hypothetical protein
MSLHTAANYLASKGRDGDSMLVHMSPGEVKGLQALALAHGGSLSINPDTGLAEASFLKRILPMVAGAALTPFLGPMGAALAMGGFETVRTGDIGKGLMAGLGAYGGANIAGNLASAGSSALATPEGIAGQLGVEGAATGAGSQSAMLADQVKDFGVQGMEGIRSAAATATPTAVPQFDGSTLMGAQSMGPQAPLPTYGQQLTAGFNQATASPQAAMDFGGKNLMNIGMAAAPMINDALTPEVPQPGQEFEDPRYSGYPYRYNLSPNFQGYVPRQPKPYYRPTGLGYAAGGDVMMAAGGSYSDEPLGDVEQMARGGIAVDTDEDTASLGAFDAAKKRMSKINKAANMPKGYAAQMPQVRGLGELAMARGGHLGGYSDGGRMLKGPGDGMSDDIPAVIGSKQPARLADGEFVVPADVVSHLGNGSTDAGAKKLYSMMDKVRTARTGRKAQGKQINPNKFLPRG